MHHDEIDSDADLVGRLLAAQQPQWAGLPVERIASTGTDNALYRLGDDMVVRLPLRPSSVRQLAREARWLPFLAPQLPLAVPVPLAAGEPSEADGFPWPWLVYPWFDGEDATVAPLDLSTAAADLARFVTALQVVDPTGGPAANAANHGRGVPLADRDEFTRQGIAASQGLVDTAAVTAAWDVALRTPAWAGEPVWLHGDIASGNLLVQDGRLSSVIDWGAAAIGDPACDLLVAWELFDAASRQLLRAELDVDDGTWCRGRGWALSTALVALPYYRDTNPYMAAQAQRKIAEVLTDDA
jgi:aminoglycoside phosphotransferase (APT) family kinase protein